MRKLMIMAVSLIVSVASIAQGNAGAKNMKKELERFKAAPEFKAAPMHRGTGLYEWYFKYTYPQGKAAAGKLPAPLTRMEKAFTDNVRYASSAVAFPEKETGRPFAKVSFMWPDEAWGQVFFNFRIGNTDNFRYICFEESGNSKTSYMLTWHDIEYIDHKGVTWRMIDGNIVELSGTHWRMVQYVDNAYGDSSYKNYLNGSNQSDEYINLREQMAYLGGLYTEYVKNGKQTDCDAVAYFISKLAADFKGKLSETQYEAMDKELSALLGITPAGARHNVIANAKTVLGGKTTRIPAGDNLFETRAKKDLPIYGYNKLMFETCDMSRFKESVTFTVSGRTDKENRRIFMTDSKRKFADRYSAQVKDGEFSFSGSVNKDNPVTIADEQGRRWCLIADSIPVTLDLRTGAIVGSETNRKLAEAQMRFKKIFDDKRKYIVYINGTSQIVDFDGYNAFSDSLRRVEVETIRRCDDYAAAACLLADRYAAMSYEELDGIFNSLRGNTSSEVLRPAKDYYEGLKKRRPGMKYVDVELEDTAGVKRSLSEFVGKGYVIVNFWEEWFGGSREDFPMFKRLMKQYGDSGLNIIGITVGGDKDSWKRYVNKRGLKWTHLYTPFEYDGRSVLDIYGVRCIPENILIGPDGRIIASDLYGPGLEKKIKEIFEK